MKYVKLKAKNYNEALQELRTKYGEDAIPISHKYIKEGGVFNTSLLAKEVVELTAAIHENNRELKRPARKSTFDIKSEADVSDVLSRAVESRANGPAYQGTFKKNFNFSKDYAQKYAQEKQEKSYESDAAQGPRDPSEYLFGTTQAETGQKSPYENLKARKAPESNEGPIKHNSFNYSAANRQPTESGSYDRSTEPVELTAERYDELKKFEKEFYEIKETLKKLADAQKVELENRSALASAVTGEKNEHLRSYIDVLKNNDYTDEECTTVIDELKSSLSQSDLGDQFKIEKSIKELLQSKIVTTGPVSFKGRKKVLMFVGPTGVGKTTSLAKLGAHLSLRENKKVVFITIDTYRIAATEQLKKYAEIMRIPIHVVADPKQFKQVIDNESADVILVDTSGRSHRNTMKISEIQNYAEQVNHDLEKYLCVSATTKRTDLSSIFNSYSPLAFDSVLITKVDETSFVGNVVKVADTYNKPISYISNGQEVPNNLSPASPETLTDFMISGTVSGLME
jgi:flagellar biosynthesis protein FlhF